MSKARRWPAVASATVTGATTDATMTADQFAALAELLRLRAGPAQIVARMVLVDGLSVPEAARSAGLEYTAASQAVRRVQRGLDLAKRASLVN